MAVIVRKTSVFFRGKKVIPAVGLEIINGEEEILVAFVDLEMVMDLQENSEWRKLDVNISHRRNFQQKQEIMWCCKISFRMITYSSSHTYSRSIN